MRRPHDAQPPLTDADRTSQTRFGPRPVPEGHKTAASVHRRMDAGKAARRVGPEGREPSMTAKIVVWGGVALGMAGIAAATSLAVRALSGDDRAPERPHHSPYRDGPRPVAPRFADLDEEEREAVRRRVRAQARDDSRYAAQVRAKAGRGRGGNIAKDLTRTATDLSQGLNGVAQSLVGAFQSFRGVSHQATSIVGDFVAAADQLRAILNGAPGPQPGSRTTDPARPMRDDDRTRP